MTGGRVIPTFTERYRAHQERYGIAACPVEDGTLANLADNECEHGFLPADEKRTCECWPERKDRQ